MRARALFVGTVGSLVLAIASPAGAKVAIAEAHISGPGLERDGLRISGRAVEGMWDAGIDVAGGLDDARAGSIGELGLTPAELGPTYVVTYRFDHGSRTGATVQQELYPYATGGPVTYTPRGQFVAKGQPWGGRITAGWLQTPPAFLRYLVGQGLPEAVPEPKPAEGESARQLPTAQATPWAWMAAAVAGLVAASLLASRLRRRVPSSA